MLDIVEGDGSMLGPRIGSFVGFQDCQKLIWWERVKKLILREICFLAGAKNWQPDKK